MADDVVLVKLHDGVATVTLNRPDAMNALNRELRLRFAETVYRLEEDPEVKVMILTGAGRAFCAGLDLKELGDQGLRRVETGASEKDPATAMSKFSGPIIGAINGIAITGGFEIALACDVLMASEHARFADTHARVGILAGWGLSQRLSRTIGIYRAKELSLTGNFLPARQAADWGLVNRVVPAAELLPACEALARDMLSTVPEALVNYKQLIDEGYDRAFGDAMSFERQFSGEKNRVVSADDVEGRRQGIRSRGQSQQAG